MRTGCVFSHSRDGDPYNIDGKDFDPDLFLQRELRSKGVHQLVDLNNEVSCRFSQASSEM